MCLGLVRKLAEGDEGMVSDGGFLAGRLTMLHSWREIRWEKPS